MEPLTVMGQSLLGVDRDDAGTNMYTANKLVLFSHGHESKIELKSDSYINEFHTPTSVKDFRTDCLTSPQGQVHNRLLGKEFKEEKCRRNDRLGAILGSRAVLDVQRFTVINFC